MINNRCDIPANHNPEKPDHRTVAATGQMRSQKCPPGLNCRTGRRLGKDKDFYHSNGKYVYQGDGKRFVDKYWNNGIGAERKFNQKTFFTPGGLW